MPPYMLKRVSEALSYPLVLRFSENGYPILNGVPTPFVLTVTLNFHTAS